MIIAVSGKGGTGKSMVATSLSYEWAKNRSVLLVDADVECPNDHLILNIPRSKKETIYQSIPKWDFDKCIQCGRCAEVCKQQAIIFVPEKNPAFVKDLCIGCKACFVACPVQAISEAKKEIGTIFTGEQYNIDLISGELKIGELASGEIVTEVRQYAEEFERENKTDVVIIDAAAGIGCPIIASIVGSDYIIAVTEPTPSALHDLKRLLYLARHFRIPHGIVINKSDLEESFCDNITQFAKEKKIPIIGHIPYRKDFISASLKMEPVTKVYPEYSEIFQGIQKKLF